MSHFVGKIAGACAAAALVGGCAKTPSEKEAVGEMVSWIGTAEMASQAWLNHTTFDRYTRETLTLSARMLDRQSEQLNQSAPNHSAALDSAITGIGHSITTIAALIAARDAPNVEAQLDSLRAGKKIVLAVSDSLENRQR